MDPPTSLAPERVRALRRLVWNDDPVVAAQAAAELEAWANAKPIPAIISAYGVQEGRLVTIWGRREDRTSIGLGTVPLAHWIADRHGILARVLDRARAAAQAQENPCPT